jgi:hypothetical protein
LIQAVFLVVVLATYFFRTAVLDALSWVMEKAMGQEKGGEDSE